MGNCMGPAVIPWGQSPGDVGWLAGVAGVDPVDVPVLLEREDKTDLQGSTWCDGGSERDKLGGKVLGLDRAGAAVADNLDLRICSSAGSKRAQRRSSRLAKWRRMFMNLNCRLSVGRE